MTFINGNLNINVIIKSYSSLFSMKTLNETAQAFFGKAWDKFVCLLVKSFFPKVADLDF